MARPQQPNQQRDERVASWLSDPRAFTSASFMGFLNPKSLSFTSEGSLVFQIVVPAGQVDNALPLRFLTRQNLPLDITLAIADEFQQHKERQLKAVNNDDTD